MVLEPPELLLPPPEAPLVPSLGPVDVLVPGFALSVSVPVFDGELEEVVLERETTAGVVGVASGSLPAACASATSNEPLCTESIRDTKSLLVERAYGPIGIGPMWD